MGENPSPVTKTEVKLTKPQRKRIVPEGLAERLTIMDSDTLLAVHDFIHGLMEHRFGTSKRGAAGAQSSQLSETQIVEALRDVADNDGHMCAAGTDAEIAMRWRALMAADLIERRDGRFRPSPAGYARLALQGDTPHVE